MTETAKVSRDDVSCSACKGSGGFIWGGDHWQECGECRGSGESPSIWSMTLDGEDYNGKPIVMVRRNGEMWTRAFTTSEARHLIRQYECETQGA